MGLFDFFKTKKDTTSNLNEPLRELGHDLEILLEKAASEPGLRPAFYKLLLDSELIVLTNESRGDEGIKTIDKGATLKIVSLKDGRIPVFTSTDRIFDNGVITAKVPFLGLAGRSLFETTEGATILLNPFSDFSKELTPSEVSSLLDGSIFQPKKDETLKAGAKIRIGQPAQLPEGFENSLIEFSTTREEIEAVYIAMIERVGSGEQPNLIVGLKISHNEQNIFGELGFVLQPHTKDKRRIEFMKVIGNEGLSGYFNQISPIYQKR